MSPVAECETDRISYHPMIQIRKVVDVVDACESRGEPARGIGNRHAENVDKPGDGQQAAGSCQRRDRRMTLHAGHGSFIHTGVDRFR